MIKKLQESNKILNYIIIFLSVYLITHFIIWQIAASFNQSAFFTILNNWDAGIYNSISKTFYDKEKILLNNPNENWLNLYAFYPLWPGIILIFQKILNLSVANPYSLIGAVVAILLFLSFVIVAFRSKNLPSEMRPQTNLGWFFLIFSPASFVFHTNHTEALFLILSWFAFFGIVREKYFLSAFLAGLCALIKNQGVVLSIIIALMAANKKGKNIKEKIIQFIYSGLISGFMFMIWPLFQYVKTDNPFTFLAVQENWQHAKGILDYFYTWIYNFRYVVQLINGTRSFRAILFYIGIAVAVYLVFYKKNHKNNLNDNINYTFYFGLYIFVCSALIPMQGFLENTFRYHLILFPLWFVLGDFVSNFLKSMKSKIASKFLKILIITSILLLNFWVTYLFGRNIWAY
ncbi:hypothetical protein [Silvanigrella aquatica]|uniref:Glycosyltransferase RgtA/B/C/D-like domain-containing protein n=1 Tax=Silvanigrella aquatica TaxID=1915309 RepID=A0A1L4D0X6_9BACT|nr:hypothetical protein [Silvanigrella aquatica]APJ03838.1 hypothetical protein AXG55_07935 [Silvanigrella aquatica]